MDNHRDLGMLIQTHFTDLYKAPICVNPSTILGYVVCLVLDQMADSLLIPIRDEDIKNMVFEIGGRKAPGLDNIFGIWSLQISINLFIACSIVLLSQVILLVPILPLFLRCSILRTSIVFAQSRFVILPIRYVPRYS